MNIFFDTSSLFILYHNEEGTEKLLNFLINNPGYKIFISQLTQVEMYSALFKKVRMGHLSVSEVNEFFVVLENDFKNFTTIPIDRAIINNAQNLVVTYGLRGLRSLDAIQLSTVISIKSTIDLALSGDGILRQLFIQEGINSDL